MDQKPEIDEVILLDDAGSPIGTAPKSSIHGADTALHLAFSCHVFNRDGELLVTRRALSKRTWPGVWTNSFCGHPRPAEPVLSAVHRHAELELGIRVDDLELALPLFRYRATDASGVVENEICPVYRAVTHDDLVPNAHEVVDYAWVQPADLGAAVRSTPWAFSPWLVLQSASLDFLRSPDAEPSEAFAESAAG